MRPRRRGERESGGVRDRHKHAAVILPPSDLHALLLLPLPPLLLPAAAAAQSSETAQMTADAEAQAAKEHHRPREAPEARVALALDLVQDGVAGVGADRAGAHDAVVGDEQLEHRRGPGRRQHEARVLALVGHVRVHALVRQERRHDIGGLEGGQVSGVSPSWSQKFRSTRLSAMSSFATAACP